jgi:putative addiction module component (TIGR02574 family)
MASATPVTTKALKLPPEDRMGLAELLLDSLDESSSVDRKLLRELTRRAADLRSGKVKGLTTKQAYGFSL